MVSKLLDKTLTGGTMEFDYLEVRGLVEGADSTEYRVDPCDEKGLNTSKKLRNQYLKTYPFLKLKKSSKWNGEYMVSLNRKKWEKDTRSQLEYYKQKASNYEDLYNDYFTKVGNIIETILEL